MSGTCIQINDEKNCRHQVLKKRLMIKAVPIRFPMLNYKQLICIFKEKIASKSSQLTESKKYMTATRYVIL